MSHTDKYLQAIAALPELAQPTKYQACWSVRDLRQPVWIALAAKYPGHVRNESVSAPLLDLLTKAGILAERRAALGKRGQQEVASAAWRAKQISARLAQDQAVAKTAANDYISGEATIAVQKDM